MKIREFAGDISTQSANLVTTLELLRRRSDDKSVPAKINTQSLINLVLNTDSAFSYDALVTANKTIPAVKNLIKSFNKEQVILTPLTSTSSDETTTNGVAQQGQFQAPVDDVSSMATRAAKARGAAISQ
jgi:hypothetical protein